MNSLNFKNVPRLCNVEGRSGHNMVNGTNCKNEATHWFEVETNVTLACPEHHEKMKTLVKEGLITYKEGDLPPSQDQLNKLILDVMGDITVRLKARGVKDPRTFAELEHNIYEQIKYMPPKKYEKVKKDYINLGANDYDLKQLHEAYKNYNSFELTKNNTSRNALSKEDDEMIEQLAEQVKAYMRQGLSHKEAMAKIQEIAKSNREKYLQQPTEELYNETKHGVIPVDKETDEANKNHFGQNHKVNEEGFCEECKIFFITKEQLDQRKINPEQDSVLITELLLASNKAEDPKKTLYSLGKRVGFTMEEHKQLQKLLEIAEQVNQKYSNDPELARDVFSKHSLEFIQSNPTAVRKLKLEENLYPPEIIQEFNDCPQCKGRFDIISEGETKEEVQKNLGNHMLKLHPIYADWLKEQGRDIFKMDVNFQPSDQKLSEFYNATLNRLPESALPIMDKYIEKVHYMNLTRDEKILKVADKGFRLKHEHEKHTVDEFNYCEDCKMMYINGEPRKPNLPSFYKRELQNCKGCIACFKIKDNDTRTKQEMKRDWEIHFSNAHPNLVEWNKKHNLDMSQIGFKVILPSDKVTKSAIAKKVLPQDSDYGDVYDSGRQLQSNSANDIPKEESDPFGLTPIKSNVDVTPNPKPKPEPKFISLAEFRKVSPTWKITSIEEWKRFTKSQSFPEKVPINPHTKYKSEWLGYPKELGYEKLRTRRLTTEEIIKIVKRFGSRWTDYKAYPDAYIRDWFANMGLYDTRDPFWNTFFKNFVEWRKDPANIANIRYWLSTGDLKKEFVNMSCIRKVRETKTDFLDRTVTRLSDVRQLELLQEEKPIGIQGIMLTASEVVPKKDTDPKWYWTQVKFRVRQIWEKMFDADWKDELKNLKKYKGSNEFRTDILSTFWKEYHDIENLNYGQQFYKYQYPPKMIQKYCAYKMKRESGYFNMASTGDYKTGSAIISAVCSNVTNVLAIVPATIVNQWVKEIRLFYPDCKVSSGKEIPNSFFVSSGNRFTPNFHVISYGLWQKKNSTERITNQFKDKITSTEFRKGKSGKDHEFIKSVEKQLDFIILDESHFVKQPFEDFEEGGWNKKSNRRQFIEKFLNEERKKNRKMRGLFMSATPTVNKVQEAKSLLEMLTGVKYTSIHNYNSIRNAVRCYMEFLPVSLNHKRQYDIVQKGKDEPITVDAFLPDHLTDDQKRSLSYLQLEQYATPYRIPKIIELLKKAKGQAVIYTYYKTGVVDKIQEALMNTTNPNTGNPYRVGLFTGDDHSGMVRKTGMVDRDGNEIVENPFLLGEYDVLLATRTFGVGFDGVQKVADTIIFNGFVFTDADFEQIIGRLVRSGSVFKTVNIHLVFARIDGVEVDYLAKYHRVKAKRNLGDCIRHGTLPTRIGIGKDDKSRKQMIDKMIKNRHSGFPEKEIVERELEEQARKELDSKVTDYFETLENVK